MVACAAQPAAAGDAQAGLERRRRGDVRRTALYRRERGGEGGNMDVMVMQAGQQQAALCVDYLLARARPQIADGGNYSALDADGGGGADFEFGVGDQHNEESKYFFFEKKETRNFCLLLAAAELNGQVSERPKDKSFLVVFFKKELQPSFLK
jgi:hypothetical protein